MENKDRIRSNVLNAEDTQERIKFVLEDVDRYLKHTLGPYGANTIIQDIDGKHRMTKDGLSLLKEIRYNDPVLQTCFSIIKEASERIVMTVGDGSTTAICASKELYDKLVDTQLSKSARPKEIVDSLMTASKLIIDYINDNIKKDISDDLHELKDIATISLNNDTELGNQIYDIYKNLGKEAFIHVKTGSDEITTVDTTSGFQIDTGYIDKCLINADNDECVLQNAAVAIFKQKLTSNEHTKFLAELLNEANQAQRSVIIIAPGYSSNIQSYLKNILLRYTNNNIKINFNIVKMTLDTEFNAEMYDDLAMATGATLIDLDARKFDENGNPILLKEDEFNPVYQMLFTPEDVKYYVGFAKTVVSKGNKTTTFIDTTADKTKVDNEKSAILQELHTMEENKIKNLKRVYELRKRIALLNGSMATIFVGGPSEQARMQTKDLVDDAVLACRSAIKYGYVPGFNTTIPIACEELIRTMTSDDDKKSLVSYIEIIRDAFLGVMESILKNKFTLENDDEKVKDIVMKCIQSKCVYNLITDEYTNTGIYNSAETESEILKNVTSIISLLITANQFITINPNLVIR